MCCYLPDAEGEAAGDAAAEAADVVAAGKVDAVAFGTGFLANPDLPARIKAGATLNVPIHQLHVQ